MISRRGRRRRLPPTGQGGFTLIETMVALSITLILLVSLFGVYLSMLSTVTLAKQRQAATGFGNQAMEQLRALPYSVISAGLKSSDLSGDANISGTTFAPSTGGISEALVTYTAGADQAPLYPHRTTRVVDNVTYTVGTYVTQAGTAQASYNLTVLVSWTSRAAHGSKVVVQRSTAYSPSGCLSSATHPFSGPCQAAYTGQAGLTAASIAVTNDTDSTQNILGINGLKAELPLPSLSSSLAVEQVTKMTSSAQTSSAEATATAGTTVTSGGMSSTSAADTDPSSSPQLSASGSTPAQTSSAQTLSGAAGTISVTPSTGDSGSTSSQAASTGSNCYDQSGTGIANGQPCTAGQVSQTGTFGQVLVNLSGASAVRSLPSFSLAKVDAAPNPSRAFVARVTASGATQCPTASSGGCITGGVSRSLGTVTVGSLPAGSTGDTLPPGTFAYAFRVSNLAESAYSESGIGLRSTPSSYSRSGGTLEYWNGTGYSTVNLTTLGADTTYTVPTTTAIYRNGTHNVAITLSSSISAARSASAVTTGTSPCKTAPCTGSATGASVLRATTNYAVTVDGSALTSFVVVSDLGSVTAQSSYQAAPDA